jgi:hypothetical protein
MLRLVFHQRVNALLAFRDIVAIMQKPTVQILGFTLWARKWS